MTSEEWKKLSKEEKKKLPFKELPTINKVAMSLFIFVAIAILATCIGTCDGSSEKKAGIRSFSVENTAYIISEKSVKSMLKAPSTAKFPTDTRTYRVNEADSTIQITGVVDAQNSFGAMLRNHYSVILKWYGSDESLTVIDVQLQ